MARKSLNTEIELYVINKAKEMRIKAGMTQKDLAFKLDLSVGFMGHIESPKKAAKYNLNHINKLAKIFNCSPQDFLPVDAFE
jgi:transcriptional regulator with XRE-family HTH domain